MKESLLDKEDRTILRLLGINPREFLKLSKTKDNITIKHRKTGLKWDIRY